MHRRKSACVFSPDARLFPCRIADVAWRRPSRAYLPPHLCRLMPSRQKRHCKEARAHLAAKIGQGKTESFSEKLRVTQGWEK